MDTYDSFGAALSAICGDIMDHGDVCRPRGHEIREAIAYQFALRDPRARTTASRARAANYGFAAGELAWYLRGARDVASLQYYNKRTPQFSDDGETLAGAYGPRLFGRDTSSLRSQWEMAADELVRDPDSRRALVAIYTPDDAARAAKGTKDVPCTLSIQFLLRRGKLHAVTTMRSCDVIWGLTNDVFSFTSMQEMMALELRERGLEVDLGGYVHQAGSLHVYHWHYEMARAIAAEGGLPSAEPVPAIASLLDARHLLEDEQALREGRRPEPPRYGGGAAWLREALEGHRLKRDAEAAQGGGGPSQ